MHTMLHTVALLPSHPPWAKTPVAAPLPRCLLLRKGGNIEKNDDIFGRLSQCVWPSKDGFPHRKHSPAALITIVNNFWLAWRKTECRATKDQSEDVWRAQTHHCNKCVHMRKRASHSSKIASFDLRCWSLECNVLTSEPATYCNCRRWKSFSSPLPPLSCRHSLC